MRIAIPTETNQGYQAYVYGHFGSAPFFTIYDEQKSTIEVVMNNNKQHIHGACNPVATLIDYRIDGIICHGMGARALQVLESAGIKAFLCEGETVEQVINLHKKGIVREMTSDAACQGHGCH